MPQTISDKNTKIFLSVLMGLSTMAVSSVEAQEKPNILFIGVDDMNCDFGAYGNPVVKSPHLDALASEGVLFANNHCQKAVSGASRASVLSGFTPEHTGITSFYMYLRDMYPDVVTIPQFFKNNGYHTVGMGKIHDPRNVSLTDKVDLVSWSEFIDIDGNNYVTSSGKPVTEGADVDDEGYTDGRIAAEGVRQIANLSGGAEPFFIAVGFKKPHLPFSSPKKYWDLYDRDSISLAPFQKFANNDVEDIYNPGAEFRNYYDNVPQEGDFPADLQREYIHGYYACVSYIDTQIGKLIDELKTQGVYDNTIIVMWGDHGFSLGDHTNWGKHTNFEYATRSPLIIKAPGGLQGKVIQSPSELLDIYPTLVDLAGFTVLDTLDGNSLVPILEGDTDQVKSFAISQFSRGGMQGFSLRSNYFQYVEWLDNDIVEHRQLFDFVNDPFQTNNIFNSDEGIELVDTFSIRLNNYLATGENASPINSISNTDSLGLYRNYHKVEFVVYEDYNNAISPIKDIQISVDMLKLPTSNKGYAALQLQTGSYSYSFDKENYFSKAGNFHLTGDTIIIDTLRREFINVNVNVVNERTGESISVAQVTIDGESQETNVAGNVSFSISPGEYNISINHSNYKPFQSEMFFHVDTSFSIRLKPSFATIKFRIKDGITPINKAEVLLNDSLEISNSLGLAYFYDLQVDSSYTYLINKEDYQSVGGTFILNTDTTVDIGLSILKYNAEFQVVDKNTQQAVSQAQIILGDSTSFSDEAGMASFLGFASNYYDYSIEKENYQNYYGNISLNADTLIVIELNWPVNIFQTNTDKLIIYPNPAQNQLNINSGIPISNLSITGISGKTLIQKSYSYKKSISMDISSLMKGVYFIRIENDIQARGYQELLIKE